MLPVTESWFGVHTLYILSLIVELSKLVEWLCEQISERTKAVNRWLLYTPHTPDTPLSWRQLVHGQWPEMAENETGCQGVWHVVDCGWTLHSLSGLLLHNLWEEGGTQSSVWLVIIWQMVNSTNNMCWNIYIASFFSCICVSELSAAHCMYTEPVNIKFPCKCGCYRLSGGLQKMDGCIAFIDLTKQM